MPSILGKVVSVTEQGNLVTDITAESLRDVPRDDSVSVRCDEHETNGIFGAGHDLPPMTLLALIADDVLQLEIVDDSAKIMLSVGPGTQVSVNW